MNQNTNLRLIRTLIITTKYIINIVLNRNFSKLNEKRALVTPCIFAGGYSSRMGFPKALAPLHNRPLLSIIYEQLQSFFQKDPIIIANDATIISAFPHYEFHRDIHPHCGPLSGLEAALTHITTPYLYIMACDMPFFDKNVANALLSATEGEYYDAILPISNGKLQPLSGIYHRRILDKVTKAIENESYALQKFLHTLDSVKIIDLSAYEKAFINVNTPKELEDIQK